MKLKTIDDMENGEFDKILPKSMTLPEWFKEIQIFYETTSGTKIDQKKPVLGWLDSKETAIKAYKTTIEFINRTTPIIN
jgi:hypothetical protein